MRDFSQLSEREVLALAIGAEEEDGRIYNDIAERLREDFPASAKIFTAMAVEENEHRHRLLDIYQQKFGDHIPLIRRQDVRGFSARKPVWQLPKPSIDDVRKLAESMESETQRFYRQAAARATDVSIRKLLGDLAEAEQEHEHRADTLSAENLPTHTRESEDARAKQIFMLQYVQPGLVGLMDGSISTLAPIFAAAFSTHHPFSAFIVGIAASVGAGISMAFAEALSDDGSLTGRGTPYIRGAVTGLMTMLGGLGHTLPFLIPNLHLALLVAICVVVVELAAISWVRWRFMDTSPLRATIQVAFGGALVFATGVLIGNG
ncbi:MAG TPA: ferritin family protein [Acidocella sp.]|jgi:rubrerythrin|uniref:iron exporter MbfA n=1 Tax=Acidocella sp. TaxID=50710 RepID=UPI002BBD5FB3|nr:ferritin family protein [Acidocella sp.]HVE21112.1 ferritin family protein [Acidocella sp.]